MNCLVCREGSLYAGDSQGEVGVWKEEQGEWHLIRRISVVKVREYMYITFKFSTR